MKKIRVRFTIYFAVGLFLFLLYFAFMFSFLTRFINTLGSGEKIFIQQFLYVVESPAGPLPDILIFLFCFISGGFLFSMFLVRPVFHIIGIIAGLINENNNDRLLTAFNKNGKVKYTYYLYREVIANLSHLSNALKQAEQERMRTDEAKRAWIAGISHDLKTPLSYINGYSSLLINPEHDWNFDEVRVYLREIFDKGVYIEKLINDLNLTLFIDETSNTRLKFRRANLATFLQNLLSDIANAPKAHAFHFCFKSPPSRINIKIDERLMYRALYNILLNCIEHNPDGTNIEVSLFQKENKAFIDIADNGVGIHEEEINKIFDKYYSGSKGKQQGKGLGLFISRQIIEAHGAEVTVHNQSTHGTVFHIVIPIT